jgi:hypothetical protein
VQRHLFERVADLEPIGAAGALDRLDQDMHHVVGVRRTDRALNLLDATDTERLGRGHETLQGFLAGIEEAEGLHDGEGHLLQDRSGRPHESPAGRPQWLVTGSRWRDGWAAISRTSRRPRRRCARRPAESGRGKH